jgi:hypothetical protein
MVGFCNKVPFLAHKLGIFVCTVLCISQKLTFKVSSQWVLKTLTQNWKRYLEDEIKIRTSLNSKETQSFFIALTCDYSCTGSLPESETKQNLMQWKAKKKSSTTNVHV